MPLYTYKCSQCGHEFDLLLGMTREKVLCQCPACGSKKVDKCVPRIQIRSGRAGSSCRSCSGGDCSTCR